MPSQRIAATRLAAILKIASMKILSVIIIGLSLVSCKTKKDEPKCSNGLMDRAHYEHGVDTSIPKIKGLKNEFVILIDTNIQAHDFVSFHEDYARRRTVDTFEALLYANEAENTKLTKKQIAEILSKNKSEADSIHQVNNNGQQLVWLINNSRDTISLQMQDWLYICILEALDLNNEWRPIEYWRFSNCGNSYYNKRLLPKTANSFITSIPQNGNYKTKLRFKLLGLNRFYYSNLFSGNIDYCSFSEDSSRYERGKPHYKLEKLINLEIPKEIKLN
jgi:hypothetical protein